MTHDHACIGPEVTYSVAIALGLFAAALTAGLLTASLALRRLWRRLGEAEERTRVRL